MKIIHLISDTNFSISVFKPRVNSTYHNLSRKSKMKKCCLDCDKNYANKYTLKTHLARLHSKDKTRDKTFTKYKCVVCNQKEYKLLSNYGEHLIKHFPQMAVYDCPHCEMKFRNKSKCNTHIKTHEKKWVCEVCIKELKTKHNLKNHMLLHTHPVPHIPCDQCDLRFRKRQQLNKHQRDKHEKP